MRALISTRYRGGAAIAADGTVPIGSATHRIGCANIDGDAIVLKIPAVVTASVGFAPTAAGDVTISMLDNGVVIAKQTVTAAAGDRVSIPITAGVRPCCQPARVTFAVNVAGTVGEVQATAIG